MNQEFLQQGKCRERYYGHLPLLASVERVMRSSGCGFRSPFLGNPAYAFSRYADYLTAWRSRWQFSIRSDRTADPIVRKPVRFGSDWAGAICRCPYTCFWKPVWDQQRITSCFRGRALLGICCWLSPDHYSGYPDWGEFPAGQAKSVPILNHDPPVYAFSTIGSTLGALCVGIILIPLIGIRPSALLIRRIAYSGRLSSGSSECGEITVYQWHRDWWYYPDGRDWTDGVVLWGSSPAFLKNGAFWTPTPKRYARRAYRNC